jgi:hypothetical protein
MATARKRPATARKSNAALRDRYWAWGIAVAVMLVTLVPYLIGANMSNGRIFMWLGYNLDDGCVYLSWMRQAQEGSWRVFNLFTTDPQHGMALNPLFLVLGRVASLTGLPLIAVYHGARMLFGVGLLALVWEFIRQTIADDRARKLAFLFVCFSSGLGWLPNWWDVIGTETPIDKWQPEAITFLSLYLNPLFLCAMILQVGIVALLLRGMQTGKARYALAAGVCGFVLGLTHSYDIITMAAIWLGYLVVQTVVVLRQGKAHGVDAGRNARTALGRSWLQALLASILTFPAVLYVYIQYVTEKVFHERANSLTLSPPLAWIILGYGLTLALAIAGVIALRSASASAASAVPVEMPPVTSEETPSTDGKTDTVTAEDAAPEVPLAPPVASPRWTTSAEAGRLLIVWVLANVAISYLPHTNFQRKMLQGTHFPIALLAGIGASWLMQTPALKRSRISFPFAAIVLTLALSLTNIRFVLRDMAHYEANVAQTGVHRTYLQSGEIQALEWITANSPSDAAIQPLPWVTITGEHQFAVSDVALPCFTPGLIGRHVYCGQWSETPDYAAKLHELSRFALPNTSDDQRIALLRKMKVRYLVISQKAPEDRSADTLLPMFRGLAPLPSYLTHVYPDASRGEVNVDADVYEVNPAFR